MKSRELLDSTLVVWGGEFGRTATSDGNASGGDGSGRDHNPYGFTMWMAGGGKAIGATGEIGLLAVRLSGARARYPCDHAGARPRS